MTLIRWEPAIRHPWSNFAMLQRRFNRLFDEAFGGRDEEDNPIAAWSPRVDITELVDKFEVTAELPGLSHEDVKVEVQDNVLSISGEKRSVHQSKERSLYISERAFGAFRRSFHLPPNTNVQSVNAEFKNGVLTVSIGKTEEAKPRQIDIKS